MPDPTPTSPVAPARTNALPDLATLLFLGGVWGAVWLFMRVAAPEVGPVWAAETRVTLAALILVAVAGRRTWRTARDRLGDFVFTGITFSSVPFTLIAFSTLTLPAGLGALLNAATPLFTATVGVVVLGQRLTGRLLAGLLVGVLAVAVVVGWSPLDLGPGTLLAVGAALGAAFSYGIAGTFVRRRLQGIAGIEIATGQLVSASIVLLPFAILSGPPGVPSVAGVGSLVAVAVISTALAWPLYFRVLKRTSATAASTVTFIVPAYAILWGALFLGEPVGPDLVVGFALIIVSLALVLGLPLPRLGRRRPAAQGSERTMPPSTPTMAPVTNDAAGDRRNAPTRPISATSP
jgi:drug/metabolite transporter (DMT)-like permease